MARIFPLLLKFVLVVIIVCWLFLIFFFGRLLIFVLFRLVFRVFVGDSILDVFVVPRFLFNRLGEVFLLVSGLIFRLLLGGAVRGFGLAFLLFLCLLVIFCFFLLLSGFNFVLFFLFFGPDFSGNFLILELGFNRGLQRWSKLVVEQASQFEETGVLLSCNHLAQVDLRDRKAA